VARLGQRAHARELARRGARIGVLDVEGDAAAIVAKEIEVDGGWAMPLETDVRDRDAVEFAVERLTDATGRLDILVSNAGIVNSTTTIADTEAERSILRAR